MFPQWEFCLFCKSTTIKIFYGNPDGFKTVQRTCDFIKTRVIQIGNVLPGRVQNKIAVQATACRIFCNVSLMTDVTWIIIDVLMFLGLGHVSCVAVYGGSKSSWISSKIS